MKRAVLLLGLAGLAWSNKLGPEPGHTGAPGDDPLGCASAGCHTGNRNGGPINAAGGSVKAVFSTGSVYYPGIPVVITVSVADPVNKYFGFQMSARLDSNQTTGQAGTFTPGNDSSQVICADGRPRRSTGCTAAAPIEFIEHTDSTLGGWQFTWTPAANQSGPVHFYIAGNAVNNNIQSDDGDHVYTASYVLNPVACTQVVPAITTVNSGSDFGGLSNITAGTWIEIKGTNLATTTRSWEGRDFLYANAPGSLDGVRVNVNSKPAFVYYVSPTQINVQTPTDTINGIAVAVNVTNCQGNSASVSIQKTARAPGLLAHPLWKVGGKQYLTALYQDGRTFVGNTDLVAGVPLRPGKPGDLITTYGIGFGDITPNRVSLSGVVVSELNQLASPFNLRVGGVQAVVSYGGLAPGFVGLYQFNFTIPTVPDGDQQVDVTLSGDPLAQPPVFLTIKR